MVLILDMTSRWKIRDEHNLPNVSCIIISELLQLQQSDMYLVLADVLLTIPVLKNIYWMNLKVEGRGKPYDDITNDA